MNPGWSLAPANQITTKGSRAWANLSAGSQGLETPGEEQRDGARTQQMYLTGDERVPDSPQRTVHLIAFVMDAPAGVSKANANQDNQQTAPSDKLFTLRLLITSAKLQKDNGKVVQPMDGCDS